MAIKVKDILEKAIVYINDYDASADSPDVFAQEAKANLLTHIDAAARMIAQVAPSNMQVAKRQNLNMSLIERPDGRRFGAAPLPSDYMRLIYLICDQLYRPITQLLQATHPTYAMQFCPIEGLGAGTHAPMGYQVDGALEVHSFDAKAEEPEQDSSASSENEQDSESESNNDSADTVQVQLIYLELPKVTGTGVNEEYSTLKGELTDVIAMQAAALYLGMNDSTKAALAQQMATGMLTGIINNEVEK